MSGGKYAVFFGSFISFICFNFVLRVFPRYD